MPMQKAQKLLSMQKAERFTIDSQVDQKLFDVKI